MTKRVGMMDRSGLSFMTVKHILIIYFSPKGRNPRLKLWQKSWPKARNIKSALIYHPDDFRSHKLLVASSTNGTRTRR